MTIPAYVPAPQQLHEVVQVHAESCRVNLLCWNLTDREAARVLAALEDQQRANKGAVKVSGKEEFGWTFECRPPLPTPLGLRRRPTKPPGGP